MDELAKIIRVMKKLDPDAPHETLLVLDATAGRNALAQVEIFGTFAGRRGLVHDQARRHRARRRAGAAGRAVRSAGQAHRRRRGHRRPASRSTRALRRAIAGLEKG